MFGNSISSAVFLREIGRILKLLAVSINIHKTAGYPAGKLAAKGIFALTYFLNNSSRTICRVHINIV